jgi:hypothetical protein
MPQPFYIWGRSLETRYTGHRVGPKAGLGVVEKRRFPAPAGNRTPTPRVVQPVPQSLYRLSYPGSHTEVKVNSLEILNCP